MASEIQVAGNVYIGDSVATHSLIGRCGVNERLYR